MKNHKNMQAVLSYPARQEPAEANSYSLYELPVIILLAAMQGIPRDYYEAASLDGATSWQRTRFVTIPLLSYALFFVTVTTLIGWLQFFDEPFVLTDGGPLGATTSLSLFIYKEGFRGSQFGYASAGSLVLFVIIAFFTYVQFATSGRWVYYEGELRS